MFTRLAAALVCALSVGGCALTEAQIDIPYKAAGGAQTGVGVTVITKAEDSRTADRNRVSAKINGFGMEMAAIRSKQEVTTILKSAVDFELKARGYTLQAGGTSVTITVKRFFSAFKTGIFSGDALADVVFGVTVTQPDGGKAYEREITATGKAANIQLATGSNAAEALSDGLKNATAILFADPAFLTALKPAAIPSTAKTNS